MAFTSTFTTACHYCDLPRMKGELNHSFWLETTSSEYWQEEIMLEAGNWLFPGEQKKVGGQLCAKRKVYIFLFALGSLHKNV